MQIVESLRFLNLSVIETAFKVVKFIFIANVFWIENHWQGLNHPHIFVPLPSGASKHHNRVKNVKTFLHLWLRQILSSFLLFAGPEFFWCLIILLYKTAFQSFAVIFSCQRFSQHTSIIINTIKQIFINQLMSKRKVRFYSPESWCRIGGRGF